MAKPKVKLSKPKAKGGPRPWKRPLAATVGVALILELAFTFVPAASVPESLKPFHAKLLGLRNSAIAKSGLPISRYEDKAVVEAPGGPPIRLFFAPSPWMSGELCKFIESAKGTLDVCVYDLDLDDVARALSAAHKKGLIVRVVTDGDNFHLPAVDSLRKNGVDVRADRRPAIMHNKFVVADASRVWTGSFNFTRNCALKNDNNALIIESPSIAANYLSKFNEYWDGKFGPDANQATAEPKAFVGTIPVEVAFSPSDGVMGKILDELSRARKSVRVMAFSFTSPEIAGKLGELDRKGVDVRCLLDGSQAEGSFSKDEFLKSSGVRLRISPNHSGRMHHKVMIIDGATVLTGSYNFSKNAELSNDENIVVVRSPALAAKYSEEFDCCWSGVKGY